MLKTSFSARRIVTIAFASVLFGAFFPTGTNAQPRTFTNRSVDYVIDFPSSKWRALPASGIVPARTRMEFVYADRGNVRLLVRKKFVDVDVTPSDMVRRRQSWDRHLAGYILVKEDSFAGRLKGEKFSYEYVEGGKTMTAVIYYLEADNRTIYSLLFTGPTAKFQSLSDQADSIARSFRLRNTRRF